ncbi:dehydrogenase [Aneurinibacillus migulanus]|uniref:gluconate 2-dehydrogenase subunit 3 family protein n=1 Tax=Aneurinibacillus migulanus TaxID=47500 RepID=UPI0005BBAF2F|nr:gluconate 2-dehydrogenase subunit 3 family protein [Aneurinibacillus migulanus]KIV53002.1 dehydrogenase [Aneurinibacillus migulanus]KPD07777.1 dehydrogenase [Aneurinibacillus migulanus]MCP1357957.1 gluconate 2-dehydrogenase subunit 3 family protein [Aneurinibacillus migulanus]
MPNEDKTKEKTDVSVSRRNFLKKSGYVLGGVLAGGVIGSLVNAGGKKPPSANPQQPTSTPSDYNQALMYFRQDQFRIVEAATERIFPGDDIGPGAKALGVAFFIDHQLAGDWGFNGRDYMQPPFYKGEAVQGYQGRLKRREIFDIALQEMQNYSQSKYKKGFVDLTPEQQDAVLTAFEKDEVKLTTVSPSGFFRMLRNATIEGVYADPLYGGNKNMDGWKLKNYPGNQMAYTQIIDKDEFAKMPPKSLKDHLH